jgi:hypothetical protein
VGADTKQQSKGAVVMRRAHLLARTSEYANPTCEYQLVSYPKPQHY